MKALDRLLQRWRIGQASRHLRAGDRVLDVGCADGALARLVPELGAYLGIDTDPVPASAGRRRFVQGRFPEALDDPGPFDAIVMLALLEHLSPPEQERLVARCRQLLAPGGRLILTVPGPQVDRILHLLIALGLADGMREEQHYGFDPERVVPLFEAGGFALRARRSFQLGLNNLFVFGVAGGP